MKLTKLLGILVLIVVCSLLLPLPTFANQTPPGQNVKVSGKFTSTHKDKPATGEFTLEFNTAGGPASGTMTYGGKLIEGSATASVSGTAKLTGKLEGSTFTGELNGSETITRGSSSQTMPAKAAMTGTFDWAKGKAAGNFENDPEFPWEFSFTPISLGMKLTIKDGWVRVAADGASKLILVAEPPAQVAAQSVDFKIVSPKNAGAYGGEIASKQVEGGKATATYQPPRAMMDPFTVEIEASAVGTDKQTYSAKVKFDVIYPPVMLVHGIWSNPSAWTFTKSLLQSMGFKYVYAFDYGGCNSCDPTQIAGNLAKQLNDPNSGPMDQLKKDKTLFTRYNLVGHSLGGLVARKYIITDDNYKRVNKLVTLGTPHLGSRFANWFAYFERTLSNASKVSNAPDEVRNHANWQKGYTKWQNEDFNWLKNKVREAQHLDATFFKDGDAVDALGWNSDFVKRLNGANAHADTIDYYFFYGDAPLIATTEAESIRSKLQWSSWADNEVMFDTFLDHVTRPGTDGVVSQESGAGQGLPFKPKAVRRFTAHHIGIVDEASSDVAAALKGYMDGKGMAFTYGRLASPAHLHAYDDKDRHVGLDAQGKIEIGIPGATYSGPEQQSGIPETIIIPGDAPVRFEVKGYQQGSFGLNVRKTSAATDQQVVFRNVPIAAGQTAVLRPSGASYSTLEAPSGKLQPAANTNHAGKGPQTPVGTDAAPSAGQSSTKQGSSDDADLGWLWWLGGALAGGLLMTRVVRGRRRPPVPAAPTWAPTYAPPTAAPRPQPQAPAARFCGKCGSPMAPGARFCGTCGGQA